MWTANEEALSGDGAVSSFTAGTTVRLQKFDALLSPAGQWAYVTDPISGDLGNNGRDIEVSGVSDLLALPSDDLLVMERSLGATPFGFRIRLYQVDLSAATDVSALPTLAGESYAAAGKALLWEGNFPANNFEGIALGPPLTGGVHSLLLMSDDGGGTHQGLYALVLAPPPCAPAPVAGCRAPGGSSLQMRRVDGERDKLVWSWRRGTIETAAFFGDPLAVGGTAYAACIYDTPGGLPTLAWAARLSGGPLWSEAGSRGFTYRDRSAAAFGVRSMALRSGFDTAKAALRGKGAGLRLPDNGAGNPILRMGAGVTAQLVNLASPAECLEATYLSADENTDDEFKSRF
jgi:hypothetical protein